MKYFKVFFIKAGIRIIIIIYKILLNIKGTPKKLQSLCKIESRKHLKIHERKIKYASIKIVCWTNLYFRTELGVFCLYLNEPLKQKIILKVSPKVTIHIFPLINQQISNEDQ